MVTTLSKKLYKFREIPKKKLSKRKERKKATMAAQITDQGKFCR